MAGKDHVIAGSVKNKAQVAGGAVLSEKARAAMHAAQTKPQPDGGPSAGWLSWGPATLVPMSTPIAQLRGSLDGRVTVPGDAGYDQARKVFYGKWDRRPAGHRPPTTAGEVARGHRRVRRRAGRPQRRPQPGRPASATAASSWTWASSPPSTSTWRPGRPGPRPA